jgi:Glyoxalase-like domain
MSGLPIDFQVTVDAAAPHDLADWWADALGWEVEPVDESFVRKMIAQGYASDAETLVHHGALTWKAGAAVVHPQGRASGRSRVLFQLVPGAKAVKNRVHLDLRPGPEGTEATVARLAARGATELHRGQQGPHRWVTMADPEGNEFCVG